MSVPPAAPWAIAEPSTYAGPALWLVEIEPGSPGFVTCAAFCGSTPAPPPRFLALPSSAAGAQGKLLSADEAARAERFVRPADRHRYRASHVALRLILGAALDTDPAELCFAAGPNGKPRLAGRHAGALAFNLSHSGVHALIGVCADGEVGVDIEALRAVPDALRLARQFFTRREAAAIAANPLDRQSTAFLTAWTCKEAVVKATGAGLMQPLDGFEIALPPERLELRRPPDDRAWSLFANLHANGLERALAAP